MLGQPRLPNRSSVVAIGFILLITACATDLAATPVPVARPADATPAGEPLTDAPERPDEEPTRQSSPVPEVRGLPTATVGSDPTAPPEPAFAPSPSTGDPATEEPLTEVATLARPTVAETPEAAPPTIEPTSVPELGVAPTPSPPEPQPYMLTLAVDGDGAIESDTPDFSCKADCVAEFQHGTGGYLTAVPDDGWYVASWNGCDADFANRCVMNISGHRTITATFLPTGDLLAAIARVGAGLQDAGNLLSQVTVPISPDDLPIPTVLPTESIPDFVPDGAVATVIATILPAPTPTPDHGSPKLLVSDAEQSHAERGEGTMGPAGLLPADLVRGAGLALHDAGRSMRSMAHTPESQQTALDLSFLGTILLNMSDHLLDRVVVEQTFVRLGDGFELFGGRFGSLVDSVSRNPDPALGEPFDRARKRLEDLAGLLSPTGASRDLAALIGDLAEAGGLAADAGAAAKEGADALTEVGWWPWSHDCDCSTNKDPTQEEVGEGKDTADYIWRCKKRFQTDPVFVCNTCRWVLSKNEYVYKAETPAQLTRDIWRTKVEKQVAVIEALETEISFLEFLNEHWNSYSDEELALFNAEDPDTVEWYEDEMEALPGLWRRLAEEKEKLEGLLA